MLPLVAVLTQLLGASAAPAARLDFCAGLSLADRPGIPSCWARFAIDGRRRLCIPRALWRRMLVPGAGRPACGSWRGKWRTSASRIPGERLRVFRVSALPVGARGGSLSAGAVAAAERWRERIAEVLEPRDRLGLARRLLLDQRSPGGPEPVLRRLGFVHVATATGIHLYALHRLIRALLYSLALAAGLGPGGAIRAARVLAFSAWFACWILAGLRPGLLRPWVVVVLRESARPLGLKWRLAAPLAAALGADLAVAAARAVAGGAPWAPGRLHYALAVGGGLLAMELARGRHERRAPVRTALREHLGLSVGSWFGTALLDAWQERTAALATPLLSLLTIPLFTLVAFPALVAGALGGAGLLEGGATIVDGALRAISAGVMAAPTLWIVPRWALLGGAALAALSVRGPRAAALALAVAAVLGVLRLVPGPFRLTQLDVGQGDAALVVAGESAGLLDAGSARATGPDRWISILAEAGRTRLDWVALTHLDEDHAGALPWIAATVPVGCVATAPAQWRNERGKGLSGLLAPLGVRIAEWSAGCFPYRAFVVPDGGRARRNSLMSAVVVPLPGGGAYLNAGDAGIDGEDRAIPWLRQVLPRAGPRLLKASHHGSKHSSSPRFLAEMRPDEIWISCGIGNPHGHPAPAALARLKATGARIRRTDVEGSIEWREQRRFQFPLQFQSSTGTATETETDSSSIVSRRRRP